jgi:protoporphyrinogen/coproporphyrinogen III oxidase
MESKGNIAVVGAGIAGLTAAYRLQQAGYAVEVFEADAQAGGRMRTEEVKVLKGDEVLSFHIDHGAQFIASGYTAMHSLSAELDIAQRIHPLAQTSNAMLRDGRLHAGDYDKPLVFARSQLLSLSAKLRLLGLPAHLVRHWRGLHPMEPQRSAHLDRATMADFVRQHFGQEALDYLLAPALSATFDTDPENLSDAFLLLVLRFVLGGFDLACFDGGIGLLTDTLAKRVPVRYQARVDSITPSNDSVLMHRTEGGQSQSNSFDHTVVAVQGTLAGRLVHGLSADEYAFFESVRYCSGIIVYFLLGEVPPLPYYGISFPSPEQTGLYGMALDHWKQGTTPPGCALVNVALTESLAQQLWDKPDETIANEVLDRLAKTPVGRFNPLKTIVHRWNPMLPQFYHGYLPMLKAFLERKNPTPRIQFAGDYLIGPYTEAALRSGERAAAAIHNFG